MDIKTLTSGALIKHPSRGLLLGTGLSGNQRNRRIPAPLFILIHSGWTTRGHGKYRQPFMLSRRREILPRLLRKSGGRNRLQTHTRRFLRK